MHADTRQYNLAQAPTDRAICDLLAEQNEGSFKAAETRFTAVDQVDTGKLARWLTEARDIPWDYKNLVSRKGRLERLRRSE